MSSPLMLPPVTSCQLPLTTHISFLSPNSGLFRIFCFNCFCATFLLFPAAADICQPLSSCQREFATPVLFCFRICFPHICFPMTADRLKGDCCRFYEFFNIQASPVFQFIHLHPESKQPSSKSFSFTLKHLQRLCATFHLP